MGSDISPKPLVSVVIPTRLRPELAKAIDSAQRQQDVGTVEIVVVIDAAHAIASPTDHVTEKLNRARVLVLEGGQGAAAARNEGVQMASGEWIAFLDDDDEWNDRHLAAALEEAGRHDMDVLVATRAVQVVEGRPLSVPTPARPKRVDESVGDYLFRRRSPSVGRASLFTSTLVVRRSIALRVPWQHGLRRHQDWGWLLRLEEAGVSTAQASAVTTRIWVGSDSSISASADWESSLDWARRRRSSLSRHAYTDFLVAQSLRYAIQARSWRGVRTVAGEIVHCRALPWPGALLFAVGALVPRRAAFRFLAASRSILRKVGFHASS